MASQPPSSPVDICNLALDRLGQGSIASILAPSKPEEDICARWYDQTRRELLREYIFNFARKPAVLTANANAPTHPDFATGYNLPVDLVRLLTIGDRILYGGNTPTQFFTISDGILYDDDNTDPAVAGLQIEYIYDAVTVVKFDSLFVKVLTLQLADNMSGKFKGISAKALEKLSMDLKEAHLKAAAVSGQEKPPRRIQRSRLRDVRRSGGIFNDATRI